MKWNDTKWTMLFSEMRMRKRIYFVLVVTAHGHFVCACAKRIEEHEFGAICYFERAPRGFLNGRSTLSKRTYQEM